MGGELVTVELPDADVDALATLIVPIIRATISANLPQGITDISYQDAMKVVQRCIAKINDEQRLAAF